MPPMVTLTEEELPSESYAVDQLPTHVVFSYDERMGKMVVEFNFNVKKLELDSEIKYMLGFDSVSLTDTTVASNSCDCSNGKRLLFVYTNIIENIICGDSKANLLRVIPCMDSRNDTISQSFQLVRYVNVRSEYVDNIRLQILDSFGQEIVIQGYICVILHFSRE